MTIVTSALPGGGPVAQWPDSLSWSKQVGQGFLTYIYIYTSIYLFIYIYIDFCIYMIYTLKSIEYVVVNWACEPNKTLAYHYRSMFIFDPLTGEMGLHN